MPRFQDTLHRVEVVYLGGAESVGEVEKDPLPKPLLGQEARHPDDVGRRTCRYLCVKVFNEVFLWDGLERNVPFGMRFVERLERKLKGLEFLWREADLKAQGDWCCLLCGSYAKQQGDKGKGIAHGSF